VQIGRQRDSATGALAAAISIALVTAVVFALRAEIPVAAAGVLYLLPVLVVSSRWGLPLGIATALASAAAFNFFHIPTTGQFTIADDQDWVALGVFLVAAVVTSTLAGSARARADAAERDRREADLTAEMARVLLGGESLAESLRVVGAHVARAFDLPWVEIETGWTDSDERRRALPILAAGERAGTVLIPRDVDPEVARALERRVIPSLETLLAAARRRDELEAQVVETRDLRRTDVVKTALLRSVSHDLRSPLTAIAAAAGGLGSRTLSADQRAELVSVIATESERLTRLVDNLLDLSRLQSGQLEPRKDWTSAEELIEAVIEDGDPGGGPIEPRVEPDLPMLEVDAAQLERALANLVDNARRHAPGPVTVSAERIGDSVAIRVSDRGPGVPRAQLDTIFEPFHSDPSASSAGTGLGLAIARGFVEASGGTLRLQSEPGKGSTFTIRLPVAEPATTVIGEAGAR
jgi:two-component system sensor histidine kinase KdpD